MRDEWSHVVVIENKRQRSSYISKKQMRIFKLGLQNGIWTSYRSELFIIRSEGLKKMVNRKELEKKVTNVNYSGLCDLNALWQLKLRSALSVPVSQFTKIS